VYNQEQGVTTTCDIGYLKEKENLYCLQSIGINSSTGWKLPSIESWLGGVHFTAQVSPKDALKKHHDVVVRATGLQPANVYSVTQNVDA
jgi:hypothetical protein